MQAKEEEDWERRFMAQREKMKEVLRKRQSNEYEALKTRLEKSINTKLKMRMNDYDKLLQRIQNLQNELITKQTLQFSKIQSANAKILSKFDLNLSELTNATTAKDYQPIDYGGVGYATGTGTKTGNGAGIGFGPGSGNEVVEGEQENLPVNGPPQGSFGKKGPMRPIMEREENDMLSDTRFKPQVS